MIFGGPSLSRQIPSYFSCITTFLSISLSSHNDNTNIETTTGTKKFIKMMKDITGNEFFPFDISNPKNYFSCLYSLRIHFSVRKGKDLVIRYEGLGPAKGRKIYVHYGWKDLYGMKLHINNQDGKTPWLLGLKNHTNQHLGISEAYTNNKPVGLPYISRSGKPVILKIPKVS